MNAFPEQRRGPDVLPAPRSRNRYVDLLRVASILFVVAGHWTGTVAWVDAGSLRLDYMVELRPWTAWLTLLFQVMPVFFFVGGYANAASWDAATRDRRSYAEWAGQRVCRLFRPVVPFLVAWAVFALAAGASGSSGWTIHAATRICFGPLWFLAVYALVTLTVPWSLAAGRRLGLVYPLLLAAAVAAVDLARFRFGVEAVAWFNYLLVWSAIHALGFVWRDGRAARPLVMASWVVGGGVLVAGLIALGYSNDMVAPADAGFSNVMPPSLTLLGLGVAQAGLLLALRRPADRWLKGARIWRITVWANHRIMTVYLWHLTALIAVIWLLWRLGGWGLHLPVGGSAWWLSRPVWLSVCAAPLALLVAVFNRFEQVPAGARPRPLWCSLAATAAVCVGLATMTEIAYGPAMPGMRWWALGLTLSGAASVYFARSE